MTAAERDQARAHDGAGSMPGPEPPSSVPVSVPVPAPRRAAPGGASARSTGEPTRDDELAARRAALEELIEAMRPAVQADGGDLELVDADVAAGVVEVRLRGACSTCAIASATLQGGVERILRDRLPWVVEVRGGVDEEEDPFASLAAGRGAYVPRF
ncbi:NifU family protein [Aciditerrimonas ferrireducens]|uniref:NifU family protein n=1 Tax=Aciditerrimonas ferrireducens TaxID=667306 RepID=A0ABV6C0D5_9ACTN|nr:NifU family protein [Aciditerrimonas ferrireducens]MCK4176252.1 NifU family protein [Aciditerrimonas ferrireducens]